MILLSEPFKDSDVDGSASVPRSINSLTNLLTQGLVPSEQRFRRGCVEVRDHMCESKYSGKVELIDTPHSVLG